jgi:hypothetical protein
MTDPFYKPGLPENSPAWPAPTYPPGPGVSAPLPHLPSLPTSTPPGTVPSAPDARPGMRDVPPEWFPKA